MLCSKKDTTPFGPVNSQGDLLNSTSHHLVSPASVSSSSSSSSSPSTFLVDTHTVRVNNSTIVKPIARMRNVQRSSIDSLDKICHVKHSSPPYVSCLEEIRVRKLNTSFNSSSSVNRDYYASILSALTRVDVDQSNINSIQHVTSLSSPVEATIKCHPSSLCSSSSTSTNNIFNYYNDLSFHPNYANQILTLYSHSPSIDAATGCSSNIQEKCEPNKSPFNCCQQVKKKTRLPRTCFTFEQIEILEKYFTESSQYPDSTIKYTLASLTKLSESRISVWFKNRRAKYRKLIKLSHGQYVDK